MPKREAQTLYKELMEEVKERFLLIDRALIGHFDMPPSFIREICYLQLRMLCEIVALACLVAHGDAVRRAAKSWSAEEMMQELEKLNPKFYPQPVTINVRLNADGSLHGADFEHNKTNWLSKGALLKFYGKSGRRLHRGSLKKLLSAEAAEEAHAQAMAEITDITTQFKRLLESHLIATADMKSIMVCALVNASTGGAAWVIHGLVQPHAKSSSAPAPT